MSYPDLANIPMGFEDADQRFFATVSEVTAHGGLQWWLWLGRCGVCNQHWAIAQEERIFDEYLIKRLDDRAAALLAEKRQWPAEFLRYEGVLRELAKRSNFPVWFDLNDSPLAATITELREANPALSLESAAELVGLDMTQLNELVFGKA
jgi:hypothetical protein